MIATNQQAAMWEKEYISRRYLRNMQPETLRRRIDSLTNNIWSTDYDGSVIYCRYPHILEALLRLLLHSMIELAMRERINIEFSTKNLRDKGASGYVRPRFRLRHSSPPYFDCLTKYGNKEHIQGTFNSGKLKLSLASRFDDKSLNEAQYDDELNHFSVTPDKQLMLRMYGSTTIGGPEELLEYKPLEFFQMKKQENHYIWCCAKDYDIRLFPAFRANAAIIIRDKSEFNRRIEKSTKSIEALGVMTHDGVKYYDPYNIDMANVGEIFFKRIEYIYQNEYRYSWSTDVQNPPNDIFVEIGGLNDIAEYVELED